MAKEFPKRWPIYQKVILKISIVYDKNTEAIAQWCSMKKMSLKISQNFTGKHQSQSLLFNKVTGRPIYNFIKKRLWHRCVHVNFAKFIRTPFLTEYLRWLLHKILSS